VLKEGNADEANKTIKKVNKTTLSKIQPETLSKYYTVLGSIHQVNTNFIQAIEYYNKSIEALKKKDEHDKSTWRRFMVNYYNLSVLFLNLRELNKAKKYLIQAEKYAIKLEDKTYLANCHYQWNGYYYFIHDYKEAEKHISIAIDMFEEMGNEYRLGLSYNNLSAIYLAQHKYNLALPNSQKAYELLKKSTPLQNFTIETMNIGNCYFKLNDMKQAKKWFLISYKSSKSLKSSHQKLTGCAGILSYYKKIKDYKNALKITEEIKEISDEIYNVEKEKRILEVEEKYQTNIKQKEINDRIKKQREINKYLKQVEMKNEELRQFSYALAHDLKEPIRSTKNFLHVIEAKEKFAKIDNSKFFTIVNNNLDRMNQLIIDILDLTVIDFEDAKKESIELSQIIEMVKLNLAAQMSEKNAIIRFDKLPTVNYFKQHLMQIFQNLISNGIKYNKNNPIITITATPQGTKQLIKIKDNGIGIPKESIAGIFGLFKRAHSKDYQGTGVGLSIVKKIIEKNDGEISVHSEEGVGTEFHFTI
nr:tetratricopeptide repeat-containing sensor histidine kinase [Chitinophagales bacterium]